MEPIALAKLDHIRKYANALRSLYPNSAIMIIENQMSWFFQLQTTRVGIVHRSNHFLLTNALQEANLQPVVDVLDNMIKQEGKNFRGILLHVMSNGEC
jgi:hypothetical protein